MNWVDVVILIVIAFYLIGGFRKGLISALFQFIGLALTIFLAVKYYLAAGELIAGYFNVAPAFSKLLGFLAIGFLVQAIYSVIAWLIYRLVPSFIKESVPNRILGTVPAAIEGLIVVALVLTLTTVLPLNSKLKENIDKSKIGKPILFRGIALENYLEKYLRGVVEDTLTLLTVKPESSESIKLNFSPRNLQIDEKAEDRMLMLVNEERAKRGLKPLTMDEKIREVARNHSREMFENGYFSHTGLDGSSPADRLTQAGIIFKVMGENLALSPTVESAHIGLMNSPDHRKNILTPQFGKVGIGVISSGIYGKMFTQDFTN